MKPVTNRTQNRVRREDANGRQVAELRKTNNQLKRLVTRLKKELNRLDALSPDDPDFEEPAEPIPEMPTCGNCGNASILAMNLPNGKVLSICKTCKAVTKN